MHNIIYIANMYRDLAVTFIYNFISTICHDVKIHKQNKCETRTNCSKHYSAS